MSEDKKEEQNIPPEVMEKLPPEIRAQLGIEAKKEEPKTIFAPGTDTKNITDSLARLRDGFEKIGLTLIGRMGEFTTTLERVSMAVGKIDKVESSASEVTYLMKKIEKKLDEFNVNFSKMTKNNENISFTLNQIKNDINELKNRPVQPEIQQVPVQSVQPEILPVQSIPQPQITVQTEVPTPIIPTKTISNSTTQDSPKIPKIDIPEIEGEPINNEEIAGINVPDIEGEPIIPLPTQSTEVPSIEGEAIQNKQEPESFDSDATPNVLIEMTFDSLSEQIQPDIPFFKMAEILDLTRDNLQKTVGWDPIIYSIGKEARNLRRSEGNIDYQGVVSLLEKINEWKTKLIKMQ